LADIDDLPRLQRASLDHRQVWLHSGWRSAFDFSSNRNANFAPLEVLKLNGHNLESTKNHEWAKVPEYGNTFPEYETDEWDAFYEQMEVAKIEQISKESNRVNIEEWLDAMDWSKLHTLHLSDDSPEVVQHLSGSALPSLRHLSLSGIYNDLSHKTASIHETSLSNTILPLESIAFRAISDLKPDTLIDIISSHHSPALKHMQLTGTLSHLTSQQNIPSPYRSSTSRNPGY